MSLEESAGEGAEVNAMECDSMVKTRKESQRQMALGLSHTQPHHSAAVRWG